MFLAGCITLAAAAARPSVESSRPSIIFILADDLGYGDYSLATEVNTSSFRIPTPNIARLAKSGVQFSRGYSMQVCAPSRCTLMTGRHLGHCTIRGNDGAYTPLLSTDLSIGAVMKRAGYRTGVVGKWGLGNFNTSGFPTAQGFDYYVGQETQVGCHDWYPLTVSNNSIPNSVVNTAEDLNYETCLGETPKCTWANDLCRDQGLHFISDSVAQKKPYFLYLATTTPHVGFLHGSGNSKPTWYSEDYPVPHTFSQRFLNETGQLWSNEQRQFAAAVWAQDAIVGSVLDLLEELGTTEETVVFFSGDNGPDGHALDLMDDPGIFRGKKRSLHEGGIRQTIVAHWPGVIVGSRVSDRLFTFYDVLPTAADLAGLPREQWGPTDGVSAKDLLLGTEKSVPERYIYLEFCHYGKVDGLLPQVYQDGWIQAVRWDDNETEFRTEWKAIRSNSDSDTHFLLYNLTNDQTESHPLLGPNISSSEPAVIRARKIILEQMSEAHVEDPYWKSSKSYTDRCCNSCFSPEGCGNGCKTIVPSPPPPPPPILVSKITSKDLTGKWESSDGAKYNLHIRINDDNVHQVNITREHQLDSVTDDCWSSSSGTVSFSGNTPQIQLDHVDPKCAKTATVSSVKLLSTIDVDYHYSAPALKLQWEGNRQLTWTRQLGRFTPTYT